MEAVAIRRIGALPCIYGMLFPMMHRLIHEPWLLRGRACQLAPWPLHLVRSLQDGLFIRTGKAVCGVPCPICTHGNSLQFAPPPGKANGAAAPRKYLCRRCGHFFDPGLDGSLDRAATVYRQDKTPAALTQENARSVHQLSLLRRVLARLDTPEDACVLDFGCGSNRSPTRTLRAEGIDAHCCDILADYPYDEDIFFQYELNDPHWRGRFDALCSIDVIEHLGDTLKAWGSLNRMLKPGGWMAHCFPARMHYALRHPTCLAAEHACIFSRRSLQMTSQATGFRLMGVSFFPADVPFVFEFQKVGEAPAPS